MTILIPRKYIYIITSLLFSISLTLTRQSPNVVDFVYFLAVCLVITYINWHKTDNLFLEGYHWSFIDKKFIPIKKIAGVNFGEYDLIEKQKKYVRIIGNELMSKNQIALMLLYSTTYAFYHVSFSSDINLMPAIICYLFLFSLMRAKIWGTYQFNVHLSIIPIALSFHGENLTNIIGTIVFFILYFFCIKLLNTYLYQRLNIEKQYSIIKMDFPFRPIIIAIATFLLLNILIPSKNSLFNLKVPKIPLQKQAINRKAIGPTKNLFNKNRIDRKTIQNIMKTAPTLKALSEKMMHEQSKLEYLLDNPESQENFESIDQQYNKWNQSNEDLLKEITSLEHIIDKKSLKKLKQKPQYHKIISDSKNEQLNQNQLNKLQQEISKNGGLETKQEEKLEELIMRLNSSNDISNFQKENIDKKITSIKKNLIDNKDINKIINKSKNNKSIKQTLRQIKNNSFEQRDISKSLQPSVFNDSIEDLKKIKSEIQDNENKDILSDSISELNLLKNQLESIKEGQTGKKELSNSELRKLKKEFETSVKNPNISEDVKKDIQKLNKKIESKRQMHHQKDLVKEFKRQQSERSQPIHQELEKLKNKEYTPDKTDRFRKLKKFVQFIAVIFLFILIVFVLESLKKVKIKHDETIKDLDINTKKEIKELLKGSTRQFKSIEDEIIYCYQFFHDVINKLFYQNELKDYSPPPRALRRTESKLSKRYRDISDILSNAFSPIFYGKQKYNSKNFNIKTFRKSYKEFLKLTARMIK